MTSNAETIDLTIKTLDSKDHKFCVPNTFTILELKEFIAAQVNVAVVEQRLIFCGRVMSNETKLADIGIDGKVMHLVQKVPHLSTTTSGSSSSTTTNTTRHAGPRFGEWHFAPPALLEALGIPTVQARESPRLPRTRDHETDDSMALSLSMIIRANEVLNRLEHSMRNSPQSSASNAEQFPEGSQQAKASSPSVPPEGAGAPESSASESSVPQSPTDPDSVNVSNDVNEAFPNDVVVTTDATHHLRSPLGLMGQVHNHTQANNLFPMQQNATETYGRSTNQSSAEQATRTLPYSTSSEQPLRNDRQTSDNRSTNAINGRQRVREVLEELNKLNERFQPFYAMYCRFIIDDPIFHTTEGEYGTLRVQSIFNAVSEVMHFISHVYHAISDMGVAFNRGPRRSVQPRPRKQQSTISYAAHTVTTTTTAAAQSTQQPTSTQTTTTSQSIPSVRAHRFDYGAGKKTPNVFTSATETNTNTNMSVDPNTESNNTSTEFSSSIESSHDIERLIDLTTRSMNIGSVESEFIHPTAPSATGLPAAVSQPQQPSVTIPDPAALPIHSMGQRVDVISIGVHSRPTTSTQTPRVTPRTTDSSQGLAQGRWNSTPLLDPFLPCSSHHLRPILRARRLTRRTNRTISSATSSNSTTVTSSPTFPNVVRSFAIQPRGRLTTLFLQEPTSMMSGIYPIPRRTQRNNTATTSARNIAQATGQSSTSTDDLARQTRVRMEHAFEELEREGDFDRTRDSNLPPANSSVLGFEQSMSTSTSQSTPRPPNRLLTTRIGEIPYLRRGEGRALLLNLLLRFSNDWTLRDIFSTNLSSETSTLRTDPVATQFLNLILDRIRFNSPSTN